jgi:type IV secretory pathway VirB10-like protein
MIALNNKIKITVIGLGIGLISVLFYYFKIKPEPIPAPKIVEKTINDIGDVKSSIVDSLDDKDDEESRFVMSEDFFRAKLSEEEEEKSIEIDDFEMPEEKKISKIYLPELEKVEVKQPEPAIIKEVEKPKPAKSPIKKQNQYLPKKQDAKRNSDTTAKLLEDQDFFPSTTATYTNDLSRIVTTDTFIPAVMYTAINSEIPSRTVLAIVESDVFGFHGKKVLIPHGSKVEGVYEKLEDKHARRMQITWFKITRPDGVIIRLNAESGDQQGAGGLGGYLDQRLKDRYGGAIMLSTINALAQMSVKENDLRQLAAVESFGREFGTLTAQIIRENINILPIILIKQGTRFNIRPFENIYFPPPKDNNISALFLKYNNNK